MTLQPLLALLARCYADYSEGTSRFSAACKVGGFKDNLGRQHEDKAPLLAMLFTPWGEGIT